MYTTLKDLVLKNIVHTDLVTRYLLWDTNDGTNHMYTSVLISDPEYAHSTGTKNENIYIYAVDGELDVPVIPLDGYLNFGVGRDRDGYYENIVRASILNWDVVVPSDGPIDTKAKMNVLKVYGDITIPGLDIVYDRYYIFPRDEAPFIDRLEMLDLPWGISPISYDIRTCTKFVYTDHSGFMKRCTVGIYRNDELFMELYGNPAYNIDKARTIIEDLNSHPCDFTTIDYDKKILGRKVWVYDQPGIITSFIKGQAAVIIAPDGMNEFKKPNWATESDGDEYMEEDIKMGIFDKNIWWFREDNDDRNGI